MILYLISLTVFIHYFLVPCFFFSRCSLPTASPPSQHPQIILFDLPSQHPPHHFFFHWLSPHCSSSLSSSSLSPSLMHTSTHPTSYSTDFPSSTLPHHLYLCSAIFLINCWLSSFFSIALHNTVSSFYSLHCHLLITGQFIRSYFNFSHRLSQCHHPLSLSSPILSFSFEDSLALTL